MVMKNVKRLGLAAMMLLASVSTVSAQDELEATVSADAVSRYIWRGQDLGGVSFQPTLGVSYKGLSLSAWSNVGLESTDTKEFDLTLAYSISGFNIGVTDYWFTGGANDGGRYFLYDAHRTNHIFEANVGYDLGFAAIQWYTNFAGADYRLKDNGEETRAFSSYVEVSAPFTAGGVDWVAAVGAVPFKSSAVYGGNEKFAVINASLKASKDIKVTPTFSIPVFAQLAANPYTQKAYMVFGFTLKP